MLDSPALEQNDYLERILKARVYDVAIESPLELAPGAFQAARQPPAAQARGPAAGILVQAARRLQQDGAAAAPRSCARGVIAASAGNHAQGVALAAQRLGCRAVIVMPVTTPRIKVDAVAARGARSCCTAIPTRRPTRKPAAEAAARPDLRPSLRRPDVIAGQGTIGMEILRQHPGPIDAIFVAGRRRRPDLRHRRLREAPAARRSGSSASSRSMPTRWRNRSRRAGASSSTTSACSPTAWR